MPPDFRIPIITAFHKGTHRPGIVAFTQCDHCPDPVFLPFVIPCFIDETVDPARSRQGIKPLIDRFFHTHTHDNPTTKLFRINTLVPPEYRQNIQYPLHDEK
jgi:hypothetical protein